MNPYIREIILDKRTSANDLGDILLECEVDTVEPIMEIIDKEIGESFESELDIFDWIDESIRNHKMLRSLAFQEEWWIIHKKLRRMIRKNEYLERNNKEKVAILQRSKSWNNLHEVIIDEKIQIADALDDVFARKFSNMAFRRHVK